MKQYILFFLLLTALSGNAQVPNPFHRNVDGLAKKFKKEYPDDSIRTIAIYDWLTGYLRYDLKAFKKHKFKVNGYSLNKVLYRRKAMCVGFSKLFQSLCLKSGIKCAQLEGYSFENPEDPYILNYYHDHAWNAAEINGHWYLFDATFDNGFVKHKKRVLWKFLNNTFGVPILYSKTKFIHKPTKAFRFQLGKFLIHSHFPIVVNGTLIQEQVSIESFTKNEVIITGNYNASPYPHLAQLNTIADINPSIPLKIAADQSVLINKKNNLVKAINYYNSLFHLKNVKSNFNKSDVDTVLKYAPLFKRDNTTLHNINIKRVGEEHKKLFAVLKSTNSHNVRLANQYNQKALKNQTKITKTAKANALKANKIEKRQLKLTLHQPGSIKKYDSIPFAIHIEEYRKTLLTGDSLILIVQNEYRLLDSLFVQLEYLTKDSYYLINKRINLLTTHRMEDMRLATYPALKIVSTAIDSLTSLLDASKRLLDKTESEYNKQRQQSIQTINIGGTLITKEYIKIQTGVSVQEPYSKDTLTQNLLSRNATFNNILVNLYFHNEKVYLNNIFHYKSAAKRIKTEYKIIQKTIGTRQMAYDYRLKHENSRYKAYQNLIIKIGISAKKLLHLKPRLK